MILRNSSRVSDVKYKSLEPKTTASETKKKHEPRRKVSWYVLHRHESKWESLKIVIF